MIFIDLICVCANFKYPRYDGEWVDGNAHGKGVYNYADGSYYDGSWAEGKMNGKGIFVYANGNKYVGDFVDDLKDGAGILQCPNGEKYEVILAYMSFSVYFIEFINYFLKFVGSMEIELRRW